MAANSKFAVTVHILAYLAYQAGRPIPSAEIARSVSTNAVVIRRLLSCLVKANLVSARKGVTGGFELALWCDLRVMEESAYFGVYCRRWGIPLIDGGTVPTV